MEQHNLASTIPASPLPPSTAANHRCTYLSPSGRRCRSSSVDPLCGFCQKHAARKDTHPDSADLSADLFRNATPSFDSVEEINSVLTNLVILLAEGRISTRRAGVITYALSFLLRGLQAIDKQAADEPPHIICDIDSAVRRRAEAAAREQQLAPAPAQGLAQEQDLALEQEPVRAL